MKKIMLAKNEKRAVSELKSALKKACKITDLRLYGSKARGTGTSESDIDVFIQVPKYNIEMEDKIHDIIFNVNLKNDVFISAIIFNSDELENGPMSESPIYKAIQREGIQI